MARAPFRPDRPSVVELAAGGIVARASDGAILLLHEAKEDRWCFPKGHVEAGESLRDAALREIREETGLTAFSLGDELVEVHYRFFQPRTDRNVLKTVVYFRVRAMVDSTTPEEGFDEIRWVPPAEAMRRVPYPADREALAAWMAP